MKTTRMLEIAVETDEVFVISNHGGRFAPGCPECNEGNTMVTTELASRLTGISWREISRRVEAGRVHFTESTDGRLFICLNSLSEWRTL